MCQSHTGRLTGLWFLLKPAFGLNTNDDDYEYYTNGDGPYTDYYFHSLVLEFIYLLKETSCLLKDEEMVEFSESPTSWKIILEPLISYVVISEIDVLTYVVLSKAEKHVPYGELVGTTECIKLAEMLHYPRSL